MTRGRKILGLILLVFVIYVIYSSPAEAASIAKSIGHIIVVAADSLFKFFNALLKR